MADLLHKMLKDGTKIMLLLLQAQTLAGWQQVVCSEQGEFLCGEGQGAVWIPVDQHASGIYFFLNPSCHFSLLSLTSAI